MTEQFDREIQIYEQALEKAKTRFNLVGYGKFALLALLIASLYGLYRTVSQNAGLIALSAVLLAALAALWFYHIKVHGEVDRCEGMLRVYKRYLARLDGSWTSFPDNGEVFAGQDHPYARDLDIVGPKSLYQLLCTAHTWHGRRFFARDLLEADYRPDEIAARQRAVDDLKDRVPFSAALEYHGEQTGSKDDLLPVLESLSDPGQAVRPGILSLLVRWVPVAVAAALAVSLAWVPALYYPALIALLAQTAFWLAGIKGTNRYLSTVMKAPYVFRHYAGMLILVKEQDFTAPLLQEMQDRLIGQDASAIDALEELDAIAGRVHVKNNPIVYFLVNVLLLWDVRCAIRLGRWKAKYGAACRDWFETLGVLESLSSLAVLPNICAAACLPALVQGRRIEAKGLGHPLLPNGSRVCNDIAMDGELFIISGSNMSGKTTFLRTVGVNLVLAMAGGFVCAEAITCSRFHVMTSMRIADDLGDGISTFYAELGKIKKILEAARRRQDLLFLIDEIFRGTNSEDRLFGAGTVIRELSGLSVMGLITTHDLALCDLERECPNVRNHSFSEQYTEDDMLFDYRIRPGRSNTTNARFLMKQVGILQ